MKGVWGERGRVTAAPGRAAELLAERVEATVRADWADRLERVFEDPRGLLVCLFRTGGGGAGGAPFRRRQGAARRGAAAAGRRRRRIR